jgi:hypothetical protein
VKSYSEYKREKVETFRKFLKNLEEFIKSKALIRDTEVRVLYLHEPSVTDDVYYSRGVIKVGSREYPVKVKSNYIYDEIEVFLKTS